MRQPLSHESRSGPARQASVEVINSSPDVNTIFISRSHPARVQKSLRLAIWAVPLALQSADACAWGLYTHVYFAQCLLWGVALADPAFRRALKRFPESVLAGACLPDLSLFSFSSGTAVLRKTHSWTRAEQIVARSESDRERALALGYASHLLVDTIAHNYFVPAHERAWAEVPVVTHALSEWAMDGYLRKQVRLKPAELLVRHKPYLAGFVAAQFGCSVRESARALTQLELAERLLRGTRIPEGVYGISRRLDSGVRSRFDRYLSVTAGMLHQVNYVLEGRRPVLEPEPAPRRTALRRVGSLRIPTDQRQKEAWATSAPSAAPARTSLG